MSVIYLCIVVFLLFLAVFDLMVGVGNDAVNFLQSAVGAKVARFRTVLVVASFGMLIGAVMSAGMMDVARHGIMTPSHFSFAEVMTIFLAVMVTDVIVLDIYNSLGMPTSTTVSLVFELLGGAFILASIKVVEDPGLTYGDLLNTGQALKTILAIFVSVGLAFFFGVVVMWVSRLVFTFNYKRQMDYFIGLFGGVAFTALAYFIFLKGMGASPYLPEWTTAYIRANTPMLLCGCFVASTVVMQLLHFMGVNIFRFVVLMGTFALAMAFASNDLVNFVGVPLAGLDAYRDFMAHGGEASPNTYLMGALMESATIPPSFLLIAGIVMIVALATSHKAQNVIKTSVDLSRQDEGEEMFGSSMAARSIVRFCHNNNDMIHAFVPRGVRIWVGRRFNKEEVILEEGAAFDLVRAAVNLVLAAMLITIGTNYKLPLSTTYVTFMVAMGTSLADRAWGRESAVFRVTGVLSVIGGWFITAAVAFAVCAVVCMAMFYGGILMQMVFMGIVIFMLIRSSRSYSQKAAEEQKTGRCALMLRIHDPELVWDILRRQVTQTQSRVSLFSQDMFNRIVDDFAQENISDLRRCRKELKEELHNLKNVRRQELLGLRRAPQEIAIERNTWFHVGSNANQQFLYSLVRMLEPIQEHIENNFNPLPDVYFNEFMPLRRKINELMTQSREVIDSGRYQGYHAIMAEADSCKEELSALRHRHIDRMQVKTEGHLLQVAMVYLNMLQESHEVLSAMSHQLRAAKKFMEN
jgi:phosphate/sulfate permease